MIHKYIKLDALIKLRMLSLALSGAFAVVCGAFAIKSLVDLAMNRRELSSLIKGGQLHAADLVGSASAMTGSSIVGVGVSMFALTLVYFEQRGGVPNRLRWLTEVLLGIAAAGMIGGVISTTYICLTRSARPSAPGFPHATLVTLIEKGRGKSLRYRDSIAYYTMIFGWPTAFFLCTDLILLIMAGLRYRQADRERRASVSNPATETFDGEKKPYTSDAHVERL